MAELKVELVKIENVKQHPNADRLDLATVYGYQVVVGRGQYVSGDCAVYFPVDSILPTGLQDIIFAGSKVKLNKNRVRAARIRGAMSFGLLVDIPKIKGYMMKTSQGSSGYIVKKWHIKVGANLTSDLGVTKYEPPAKGFPQSNCKAVAKRDMHPMFSKYTDIQHGKKNLKAWQDYDGAVVLTEKIHGTNFRCGWVPFVPRTRGQKFLKFLTKWTVWNFVPEWEFVYGSHNVQLQDVNPKPGKPAHDNVYKCAVNKFDLKNKTHPGELWYFEIYGPWIQANYEYGLEQDDIGLAVIDIKQIKTPNGAAETEFLSWWWLERVCRARGLQPAPVIVHTKMTTSELIDMMLNMPGGKARTSAVDLVTPIEGGVLRPYDEEVSTYAGRFIFKFISDEYLLNNSNTDNH